MAVLTLQIDVDVDQLRALLAELRPAPLAFVINGISEQEVPARPVGTVGPYSRPARLGNAQRNILAWLADHNGTITRPEGNCTSVIADDLGLAINHCSGVLKVLAERGHVERTVQGKRTNRIAITTSGREAIGRTATWSRRVDDPNLPAPRGPKPQIPDLGPIGRLGPIDEDNARTIAGAAAVGDLDGSRL